MQLHLFDEALVVVHYEKGTATSAHEVAPQDVAAALGRLPVATGLLPSGCVGYARVAGQPYLVVRLPPQPRTLTTDVAGVVQRYAVTLPGLIFAGHGTRYWVWALPGDAPDHLSGSQSLYRAPLPNVDRRGRICAGSAAFPRCTSSTLYAAVALFFGSAFSDHLEDGKSQAHPDSVRAAWAAFREVDAWPDADLMPTGMSLGQVVEGRDVT